MEPAPRSVPVSWIVQDLGGGLPERQSGVPNKLLVNKPWNCKGALGKTSGRSIFRNAPLRATSSALNGSSSAANRKTLRAHKERRREQVAFARCRKSLLAESNIGCIGCRTPRCVGALGWWLPSKDSNSIPTFSEAHWCDFEQSSRAIHGSDRRAKRFRFRYNAKTSNGKLRAAATMRP